MKGRRRGIVAAMMEYASSVCVQAMYLAWRRVGLVGKPLASKLARRQAMAIIKLRRMLVRGFGMGVQQRTEGAC